MGKDTSEKRKKNEHELNFNEKYESSDSEINNLFGLNDSLSEDGNRQHFKRIRQIYKKNAREYLWKNHTLIVTNNLKLDGLKREQIVIGIGINPKKVVGGFDKANIALEATRRNGINAYNNLKNKSCKLYLQFDLTGKATENSKEVSEISNESLKILEKGLNQFSSRIDCIEIAWGKDGQNLLNRSVKKKQSLNEILFPFMKQKRLYQFDGNQRKHDYPLHFVNISSKKKLVKLTDDDFKTYLG